MGVERQEKAQEGTSSNFRVRRINLAGSCLRDMCRLGQLSKPYKETWTSVLPGFWWLVEPPCPTVTNPRNQAHNYNHFVSIYFGSGIIRRTL